MATQVAHKNEQRQRAWQPFTPGGVAAFAGASFLRVLAFQLVFAGIIALTFAWFVHRSWLPVMRSAIENLQPTGVISRGLLAWTGPSPALLAYNANLALVVDLQHSGQTRVPSDLLIEFGQRDIRVFSLLGFVELEYPAGWNVAFNRTETGPWFGAWGPPMLWLLVLGCILLLLLFWAFLASFYSIAVWLLAYFANRQARFSQSWRLAGAALVPSSVVLWLGIVLYGSGAINLLGLLLMLLGHLAAGWVYIFVAPLALAREKSAPKKGNPFSTTPAK
jgi:hypothetical protein